MDGVKALLIILGIGVLGVVIWLLVSNLTQSAATSSVVASVGASTGKKCYSLTLIYIPAASAQQAASTTVVIDRTSPFYYTNPYGYIPRLPRPYIPRYNWPIRWRR